MFGFVYQRIIIIDYGNVFRIYAFLTFENKKIRYV